MMEIATLVGGIGIFLLGMTLLTDTLKKWAGMRLRHRLNQFTDGSLSGAALGAMLTALFQSSSVTTLMTIGFVSAGLLTFTHKSLKRLRPSPLENRIRFGHENI